MEVGTTFAQVQFAAPDYNSITSYEIRHYPIGRSNEIQIGRISRNAEKQVLLTSNVISIVAL